MVAKNDYMCPMLTTYVGKGLVNNTTARTPLADLASGKLTEHIVLRSKVSGDTTKIVRHLNLRPTLRTYMPGVFRHLRSTRDSDCERCYYLPHGLHILPRLGV